MTKKKSEEMAHSAVRLPRNLQERLREAGGKRGMGEEIRRRLEASFDAEKAPADPKTRELLEAIRSFTEEVSNYYGNWAKDVFAYETVRACVDLLLAHDRPNGDAVPHPDPKSAADLLFAPEHSKEQISRLLVSAWIRDRAKRAFADNKETRR